jgi:hypothetical protein
MQETPQQYTQRILGHIEGKDPLKVQRETPKKLAGNSAHFMLRGPMVDPLLP